MLRWLIFGVIVSVYLQCSDEYVWEGKKLIMPVYHRRRPTVLYSALGTGTASLIQHDRIRRSAFSNHQRSSSGYGTNPIPPAFVRSAQVQLNTPALRQRILHKPKRWAVASIYEAENKTSLSNTENQIVTDPKPATSTTNFNDEANPVKNTNLQEARLEPTSVRSNTIMTDVPHEDVRQQNFQIQTEPMSILSDLLALESPTQTQSSLGGLGVEPTTTDATTYEWKEPATQYKMFMDRNSQSGIPDNEHYMISPYRFSSFDLVPKNEYRLEVKEEVMEEMHPVRRSPSPWAARDVHRLGQPRHSACMLPVDRGLGPDEISAWYYEPNEYRCRWFGYRGYGGNANRFYSRTACESYCIRDLENLCEAVTCTWPGTRCVMLGDDVCKENEQRYGRDWRLKCSPDHAVCLSQRNTRMAPDINFQSIPPECFQPKDGGSCERKNPAVNFYYDRQRNTCMTFYYHRCGGNDNRFETKSDCMTQCSP